MAQYIYHRHSLRLPFLATLLLKRLATVHDRLVWPHDGTLFISCANVNKVGCYLEGHFKFFERLGVCEVCRSECGKIRFLENSKIGAMEEAQDKLKAEEHYRSRGESISFLVNGGVQEIEYDNYRGNSCLINACIVRETDHLPLTERAAKKSSTERNSCPEIIKALIQVGSHHWSMNLSVLYLLVCEVCRSFFWALAFTSTFQQLCDKVVHLNKIYTIVKCMMATKCLLCGFALAFVSTSTSAWAEISTLFHAILFSFTLAVFCFLCLSLYLSWLPAAHITNSRLIISDLLVIVVWVSFPSDTCSWWANIYSSIAAFHILVCSSWKHRKLSRSKVAVLFLGWVLDKGQKGAVMVMIRTVVNASHYFVRVNIVTMRQKLSVSWNCSALPSELIAKHIRQRDHRDEDEHSSSCSTCSSDTPSTPRVEANVFIAPPPALAPYPPNNESLPPYPPPRPTSSFSTSYSIILRLIVTLVLIVILVFVLAQVVVKLDLNLQS